MHRVSKIGVALIALGFVVACESASFNGNNNPARKRLDGGGTDVDDGPGGKDLNAQGDTKDNPGISGDANEVGGYPETPSLDQGGWIGSSARKDFEALFDASHNGGQDDGASDANCGGCSSSNNGNGDTDDSGDTSTKNDSSIGEGEDKGGGLGFEDGVTGVLWIPCAAGKGAGTMEGGFRGYKNSLVRVAGEFCPTAEGTNKLTVLFVVDFSGSMFGHPTEGPNDPTEAGTCGRLRAAEAVLKKFKAEEFRSTDIRVGMVSFANASKLKVPFANVSGFQSSLNVGTWCGADSSVALTNYRAAFDQATAALSDIDGDKAVFFISDGAPTLGGGDGLSHRDAGRAAAERLLSSTKDLTLNTIFLGYKNGQANDPRGYLEEITGDPSRVTLVTDADQLVEAITQISFLKLKVEKQDVSASLTPAGFAERNVPIDELFKSAKKAGRVVFSTEPFKLSGKKGQDVMNVLAVQAKTSAGETLRSEARVKFTQFD